MRKEYEKPLNWCSQLFSSSCSDQESKNQGRMKRRRMGGVLALSGFSPWEQQTGFSYYGKLFLIYYNITGENTGNKEDFLKIIELISPCSCKKNQLVFLQGQAILRCSLPQLLSVCSEQSVSHTEIACGCRSPSLRRSLLGITCQYIVEPTWSNSPPRPVNDAI